MRGNKDTDLPAMFRAHTPASEVGQVQEDMIMVGVRNSGAMSSDDEGLVFNQSKKRTSKTTKNGYPLQQKSKSSFLYSYMLDDDSDDSIADGYDIALVDATSRHAQQFLSNTSFKTMNKLREKMKRKLAAPAKF